MRGTRFGARGGPQHHRFIPARAGNTRSSPRERPPTPVHPRPCGEHSIASCPRSTGSGSSPPVRGTRGERRERGQRRRFIPARAGNTAFASMAAVSSSVRPRPCGEHTRCHYVAIPVVGSSPPVRGTLATAVRTEWRRRFIPARAGNTVIWPPVALSAAVHPRPCGEHLAASLWIMTAIGSSPPVRGTRL